MSDRAPAHAWLALGLLAATLALVAWRLVPPRALPVTASPTVFSAHRALELLVRLAPEERPRPVGSEEHRRFLERLRHELIGLGIESETTRRAVCGRHGACAEVTNLLGRLPGERPEALLLVAHYDSVPMGPGAADDGIAVASILELARAVRASPPLRHTLLLLFTDGEELGMLGARAFAREAPEAASVVAAVNLEARGTRGPSYLFRTTRGASSFLTARALPRPLASSVQREMFRLLPNDTDLTELAGAGIPGFDLAFIGGVEHYHTARDDRAHLDLRSVQHQGANALGLLRALDAGAPRRGARDAVHFDLFTALVVGWPERATLPLALAALLATALSLGGLQRRGRLDRTALVAGLVTWPAVSLATLALGTAAHLGLVASGALPFPWVARPGPALVAAAALAIATTLAATALTAPAGRAALGAGHQSFTAVAGVATAVWAPGISYLFVVPALAGALGACAWAAAPERAARRLAMAAWGLPLVVSAALVGPVALSLYPALGLAAYALHAALALLLLLPATPALAEFGPALLRRAALGAAGLALLALGAAALVPRLSGAAPNPAALTR